MKGEIFVSYRRSDTAGIAGRIHDQLNILFPKSVFLDMQNIEPGSNFVDQIERTIGSCKVLILVIGRNWFSSTEGVSKLGDEHDYVTLEIKSALRQRVPIIPVLVDGAQHLNKETLPLPLHQLLRLNAVELHHSDFDYCVSTIAKPIYGFLGLKPPTSLEKFMEALAPKFFYRGLRYDEGQRALHAILGFFMSLLMIIAVAIITIDYYISGSLANGLFSFMGMCLVCIYIQLIGMNSAKHGTLAKAGLILVSISFLTLFFLFSSTGGFNQPIFMD